jgi:primosomal protein N' (replication factor Y)
LILSSATPAIESYYRALTGEYTLLHLPKRINGAPMPEVSIIDMRKELYNGNRSPISRALKDAVRARIDRGEQSVLFLNRRGFNTYIFCRDCGHIETCPNCEVSLTYHVEQKTLRCHYCGYSKPIPTTCPECGGKRIKYMGTGTEKIEQQVAELFPDARILRLDSDTARAKGAYERF